MRAVQNLIATISRWRIARYMVASFAGTVLDLAGFLLLYRVGVPPTLAAAASYCGGIVVHWLVSSRIVFHDRLAAPGLKRGGQQAGFFATALVGLAMTTVIVYAGVTAGLDPRLAKLIAMGASFLCVWFLRVMLVFREQAA